MLLPPWGTSDLVYGEQVPLVSHFIVKHIAAVCKVIELTCGTVGTFAAPPPSGHDRVNQGLSDAQEANGLHPGS